MSVNLVSAAMQYLGPTIVARLASALGLDQSLIGRAVSAGVPAILAALAGRAATPDGARALTDVLGKQDPGLLGNLAGMIGGGGQSALVNAGTSALGSLLGGGNSGALTSAIGKFAGLGDGPAKSLVGMLAPVVLGAIGKEQRTAGLDASGLARLLAGQKDNIAAALPGPLAQSLAGAGVLGAFGDSLRGAAGQAASSATATAQRAGDAARTVAAAAPKPSSNWWMWALGLAALAFLGYNFLGRTPAPVTVPAVKPVAAPAATPAPLPGAAEAAKQATTAIDSLRATLTGVKDKASAEAALPRFKDIAGQLDVLKANADKLTPEARRTLADLIASMLPSLQPLISAAMAIPGVGDLLKTPLDEITGKLAGLAKV